MMQALVTLMTQRNLTLSTCESFTGGLFAARLTEISGASRIFLGSVVAYSNPVKRDLVRIDPAILDRYGAISAQTAVAMAENTRELFHTDLALSFTGNAGPQALEDKPAGLWFGAVAYGNQTLVFGGLSNLPRNQLRDAAVNEGLKQLLDLIRNNDLKDINR